MIFYCIVAGSVQNKNNKNLDTGLIKTLLSFDGHPPCTDTNMVVYCWNIAIAIQKTALDQALSVDLSATSGYGIH